MGQMSQVTQSGITGGDTVAEKAVAFTYDNLGEFSTISRYADLSQHGTRRHASYGYDDDGKSDVARVHVKRQHAAELLLDAMIRWATWRRRHNNTRRLGHLHERFDRAACQRRLSAGQQSNESYAYDPNGNRTNTGYSTGPNNELLSDGTYNYTYDAEWKLHAPHADFERPGRRLPDRFTRGTTATG